MEVVDGVVDFLLRERYFLSAFEFFHELMENGMADSEAVSRLNQFFADPALFPPDQLIHVQSLQETDSKKIMEEKASAVERIAFLEYELRLAQEDVISLQKLEMRQQDTQHETMADDHSQGLSAATLDQIGSRERKELNCAVKDYLVSAGYKLTAMTFCEEVNQVFDESGRIPNALQKYYRAYLLSESIELKERSIVQKDEVSEMKASFEMERGLLRGAIQNAEAEASQNAAMVLEAEEALKQVTKERDEARAEVSVLKLQQKSYQTLEADLANEKVISTVDTEESSKSGEMPQTLKQTNEREGLQQLHLPAEVLDRESPDVSEHHITLPEQPSSTKQAEDPETIHILAESLPNIVPYVLINHREELLPLMICAIGRHPDSSVRDSLTHILFNLIKRPDEGQRRIIMDACISLSMSIGEIRTESELLPQCWEQINHNYEERRLLVAQSCGELGRFVRSDMRSSLILSILEQLIEDPAAVVREAASFNLAKLLPLFPNTDKYTKVEKMMFHLLSDSSGQVIETTLNELVPAIVTWTSSLRQSMKQLLQALFVRMLTIVQRCPPMSGVETSFDSQLRVLGERGRWNVEVLVRMLIQLLPHMRSACLDSCPYPELFVDLLDHTLIFSSGNLFQHLQSNTRWEYFDWIAMDFLPTLLKLLLMLSVKEEALRKSICQLLLKLKDTFGKHYHITVVQPIFLTAIGDDSHVHTLGSIISDRIKSFKPQTEAAETLAFKCILPVLLVGVLGIGEEEFLATFLKSLILDSSLKHGLWSCVHTSELVEAIRFFCSYDRHHEVMTRVLWELVVNSNVSVKVNAALLLKELVPYARTDLVAKNLLPALVTLGSDTNLEVKHTTIPAYGIIAQHFHDETVTEKIRVQMDSFLDDGSNEAISGVVRALTVAVPLASPSLRDYLLQKLVILTASSMGTNLARRRERADVFCEAVRSLDATDLSPTNIRELLLPTIQNLMRDPELLDPAHKEALEFILRERSAGKFEAITKVVMGAHLNMSSMSMTSIFGDSTASLATPKPGAGSEPSSPDIQQASSQQQEQEGVLKRMMMRTNFWRHDNVPSS